MSDVDLAIVGSGFGGSILAMIARRLGRRVLLLERGRHPRFAIGESASPLAGLLIETLADRYELPRLRPLGSYGAWKRQYPRVTCGLKRGFTYFKHRDGSSFEPRADRTNELLVAASPNDEVSDTHWYRAEVDHFLVQEAVAAGADYLDRVTLDGLTWLPSGDAELTGTREGRRIRVTTHAVVDASGPRGFLARALGLQAPGFDDFPPTQALFSHFRGVTPCDALPEFSSAGPDETRRDVPPYPIDDAALHHVFDGGWMWVLRFENGITSAGVAVTDALAAEVRLADKDAAWQRLLARFPTIATQFVDAEPVREFTWMPRVAFRASRAADRRWALLPSAAAFVDPLFSTGMPLTLFGIERLAGLIETGAFATPPSRTAHDSDSAAPLRGYSARTLAEADQAARFVAGCYRGFPSFDDFTAYSMFYFAAASHAEMARRLGVPGAGFLGLDAPAFGEALHTCSPAVQPVPAGERLVRIAKAVAPWNVAGLCDPAKRNWYGVDLDDTVRAASKLGVTEARVRQALGLAESGADRLPPLRPLDSVAAHARRSEAGPG